MWTRSNRITFYYPYHGYELVKSGWVFFLVSSGNGFYCMGVRSRTGVTIDSHAVVVASRFVCFWRFYRRHRKQVCASIDRVSRTANARDSFRWMKSNLRWFWRNALPVCMAADMCVWSMQNREEVTWDYYAELIPFALSTQELHVISIFLFRDKSPVAEAK